MTYIEPSELVVFAFETVFKVSVLLAIVALFAGIARRRFPTAAHMGWVLVFCAVIVLPFASLVVPWNSVLFLSVQPQLASTVRTPKDKLLGSTVQPNASESPVVSPSSPIISNADRLAQPPLLLRLAAESPWMLVAFAVWLVGFFAVSARSAYGLYCLRMIRRFGTVPLKSKRLAFEAQRLSNEVGQRRDFDLRISTTPELPIPMTWGTIRPTIVLPVDGESWTDKRFEATLLHELSHVRRCDYLTQMVAEFACALYWFNPVVWLSARTMRSDAELAADEAVLHSGLRPSDYAKELLMLAADLGKQKVPFATLGTPAMTNSKIETRLESILSPSAGKRGITSIQMLAALEFAVLVIPTFASLHASAYRQVSNDPKMERTEALSHAKQIALAAIMYSNDFDNDFPYAQQTASVAAVLQPYTKNQDMFKSPTKGGKFLFNLNLAGVNATAIEKPAETPLWIESLPDPKLSIAVAYSDGHAKLIAPEAMADLKKAAAVHFKRAKNMKPLPYNYLLPKTP